MPKINVNGINLYYEIQGHGQPIVFVSGFSGDHTAWNGIIHQYAKQYQTITFDNRGAGQSDCPDYPYTIEMMAEDTASLAKALSLPPAHFISISMGGCIVQNLAYLYPELCRSIVLTDTFAEENIRTHLYAETRSELIKAQAPQDTIIKCISMLCYSQQYLKQPGTIEKLVKKGFYPITMQGYESQRHAMAIFNSTPWLHHIETPSLVIGGDDDLLATKEQTEQLAKAIPNAQYHCFHNVGHVPFFEQPDAFNQLVLAFVAKHS